MITTPAPVADSLDRLHDDMDRANLAPTWKYVSEFVARSPRVAYRPFLWKWDDVVSHLMRAGDLITPEKGAERRSMEHVNPDLKHAYATTHTIATAFQLVRAGESAPSHRHQAAAIRFIIDSKGGEVFSRVNGEPLHMDRFDLLLTPSGIWHEHENRTEHDIIWLDALDFPLVNLLQCSWFESGEGQEPAHTAREITELAARAARPVGWQQRDPAAMRWTWAETSATLDALGDEAADPFAGMLLEYVNPLTNGATLPTLSCRVQRLEPGFAGRARRKTSSTVFFAMEGSGFSVIAGERFDWAAGDVFMVPTWAWCEHHAGAARSHLFSITDEPVLRMLGMYREETLAEGHQKVTSTFSVPKRGS